MSIQKSSPTVRRSVALPRDLVDAAMSHAPDEVRGNFNRLVATALTLLIEKARQQRFAQAMADMAADPAIQHECDSIAAEFGATESDGLEND